MPNTLMPNCIGPVRQSLNDIVQRMLLVIIFKRKRKQKRMRAYRIDLQPAIVILNNLWHRFTLYLYRNTNHK